MKRTQTYFFIDFDSTIIRSEGIEELAAVALTSNPDRDEILAQIKAITDKAMEGRIAFGASLEERLKLLSANKDHVKKTAAILKKHITPSVARNAEFFKTHNDSIYIISGGFKEFVMPFAEQFGIHEDHIFANTFLYDKSGNITGVDKTNPMSRDQGKVNVVKSLNLEGDKYMIGDGYTDYQLKEQGLVKKFVAFIENIERQTVSEKADDIAPTFDEFLYVNKLPMSVSYPKSRIKVMLLESINNDAVKIFEKEGYSVHYYTRSMSEEELKEKIKPVYILGVRSRTQVTKSVLKEANRLLAIGSFGIGLNHIDLESAALKGISVFNAPYSSTRSVAELVIGEMIMLNRGIFDKSIKLHKGIWHKTSAGSEEVKGKTLGIIGYGTIGSHVGVLAESLGMSVCFYDIVERPVLGNAHQCESMEELLAMSDIITLHVDGRPQNRNLIGEKQFKAMKDDVIFINASRGFVVDVEALRKAVKGGKVHGSAVDVFPKEPKSNDEPFVSPLQNLPNVILTPHIGAATTQAQTNIAHFVSEKVIDYINNGNTYLSANLPNIQLPEQGSAHRLLHLHKNVPGVLAKINSVLAEHDINIVGQYLKTNEKVGYVITDVDKKYDKEVLNVLKQVPDTIRFRVLY